MMVTVLPGDTAWEIAQRNKVSLRDFLDANALLPPYGLNVGDRLKIPFPATYKTMPGDDVRSVARMFGVSAAELVRFNDMKPPYALPAGQVLRLPGKGHERVALQKPAAPVRSLVKSGASVSPAAKPSPVRKPVQPVSTSGLSDPGRFSWPLQGKILSGFGKKTGGGQNDGLNIGGARGAPVRAAADGVVAYADDGIKSYGNLVLVRHGGGYTTAYAHLGKTLVKKGARIARGESLGTVGSSGTVDTPQLHFEIRKGREPLDPGKFLGKF
ncbi:MAG: hypothetical protein A2018_03170 [Alphaproteobacteria bacterium GWF2_58_20]|nr:MAG: hypothetical protein A2018_03170 [Alphaproteobacteria bacterium GWF2_58_20]